MTDINPAIILYAFIVACIGYVVWQEIRLKRRPRDIPLGQHDCDEILNALLALFRQGKLTMAKIDELNEAVAQLAAAVAALPGRLPTQPDLQPSIDGVKAATDAVNGINPAATEPAPG